MWRGPCARCSGGSADLQSAVSRICNPQEESAFLALGLDRRAAEYNSAIRQIANLRYSPSGGAP